MAEVLREFITILTGGLGDMAVGLGSGVNSYVTELFLTVDSTGAVTGLSSFGGTIAVFGAVALAVGLTTGIFLWIRSIGK